MAKKVNSFAADFQAMSQSADDKVLAFLTQGKEKESKEMSVEAAPPEPKATRLDKVATETSKAERRNVRPKPKQKEKRQQTKPSQTAETAESWSKPVAIFNTRIPQEMSDLLDDLVYQRKKEGHPITKQQLAIEALGSLLASAGLPKPQNESARHRREQ